MTLPPRSLEVNQGGTAIFFVTASGTKPLSYQWIHDGAVLSDFDRVSGTTTSQLTIADAQPGDAGNYSVVVLNATGSTTSDPATLVIHATIPPTVTEQPVALVVKAGSTAQFSVTATGTAPLTYQWQRNGSPIAESGRFSGTTTPLLSIAGVSAADEASYTVVVQNTAGAVTSDAATLKREPKLPPTITQQPQPQVVKVGDNAQFSVTATGTAPLDYQWKRNGTALTEGAGRYSGTTTAQLTITGVESGDVGDFTVTVQNTAGSATSEIATLKLGVSGSPTLSQPSLKTDGTFHFFVSGDAGQACEIQYAADPQGPWTKLADITLGSNPTEVQDSDVATHEVRFYRALIQ